MDLQIEAIEVACVAFILFAQFEFGFLLLCVFLIYRYVKFNTDTQRKTHAHDTCHPSEEQL